MVIVTNSQWLVLRSILNFGGTSLSLSCSHVLFKQVSFDTKCYNFAVILLLQKNIGLVYLLFIVKTIMFI